MNLRIVRRVFAKELRETLRDRRTLLIMLVVPVFLYPALLVVIQQLTIFGQRQLEEAPVTVVAQGGSPHVLSMLDIDPAVELEVRDEVGTELVSRGEADLVLDFGAAVSPGETVPVDLLFDPSRDRSRLARDAALVHLYEWEDSLLSARLVERGLPADFAEPIRVTERSVATPQRMGGYALGRFLPMLLILMTLLGAFYPAIDLSAGEKERGTLETLLTTPVPAREIVAGKFLTVTLIAVAAATLNLASMLLTFRFAAFQLGDALDIQFSLPWSTVLLVILFLIPLAVFFSAIFLGIALRAQSFKEAQNTLTPIQLASMIPMMLPLIAGMPLNYAIAIVPIGGVALLFREMMAGEAPFGPGVLALAMTIVYAGLALRFAARSFGREEVLFGGGSATALPATLPARLAEWRARGPRTPSPTESLAFVSVVALLYFYLGTTLQIRAGEWGILISQFSLLALPALLFVRLGGFGVRDALALRLPTFRQLAGALLLILGGIPFAWLLGWVQSLFMEIPEEFLATFEDLIRADSASEIGWLLLLVAITPAICEELVFRGVLLQGLTKGMTTSRAVGLSALIFGAFHLSIETAIRFLPSAWLGLLLAYVAWRTRSIVASMLMHFVNNAFIVLVLAMPALEERVSGPSGEPHWILVGAGFLLFGIGLKVMPPTPTPHPGSPPGPHPLPPG